MTSAVSICNLALTHVRKMPIEDINEATAEARACKQYYDITRDTLIQMEPWRAFMRTLALAAVANDRPEAWGYAFARPNDALKVWRLRDSLQIDALPYSEATRGGGHRYDIEGGVIYCDINPAYLVFGARTYGSDPARYSPLFVQTFAWHLASCIANPLTGDAKLAQYCLTMGMRFQSMASTADANEVRETTERSSEAIEARGW